MDSIDQPNGGGRLHDYFLAIAEASSKAPDVMTLSEVAKYTFKPAETLLRRMEEGTFPEPDERDGEAMWWYRETVDAHVCPGCKTYSPCE